MNATLRVNRLGYDSPPPTRPILPKGERARGQLWSDVVFEAVLALRTQLISRNESIAAAAANSILELERTRMRHDKSVSGSRSVNEAREEFERDPSGEAGEGEEESESSRDDRFPTRRRADRDGLPIFTDPPQPLVDGLETRRHDEDAPEESAFENHTRTVRDYFTGVLLRPMTEQESEDYVEAKLWSWTVGASAIPRGGFIDRLRSRKELPEPAGSD